MSDIHELDLAEIEEYRHEHVLASGRGRHGQIKRLRLVVEYDTLSFEVFRLDGVGSSGLSTLREAVEAYNEL